MFKGEMAGVAENEAEAAELQFERYANEIADKGLVLMELNHGSSSESEKVFHTVEHPKSMMRRAIPMEDAFNLPPEKRALVNAMIGFHDIEIEFDKPAPDQLLGTIKRHRGARAGDKPSGAEGNEGKSADDLEAQMRKTNEEAGSEVFSEEDMRIGRLGIDFTYPDVKLGSDFNGQVFAELPHYEDVLATSKSAKESARMLADAKIDRGALFIQPHLDNIIENNSGPIPPEALIVAFADLGEAGSEPFEVYKKGGNGEFQELYANISNPDTLYRLAHGNGEKDPADREMVVQEFQKWLGGQISFAFGQILRFEKNLLLMRANGTITQETEDALRAQFSHFEDNIKMAIDRRDRMGALSAGKEQDQEVFKTFALEMGYEVA